MSGAYRILLLLFLLLLSGCGLDLDGTYVDSMGLTSYTFKSGGKAYVGAMGLESEISYEVDDDRIRLTTSGGGIILRLMKDGTLQGPMNIIYTKQK